MQELLVDDADGLRTITINRPESKNALTSAMRARLCELLSETESDDAVKAVVLTAVDPVFSAGVDYVSGDFVAPVGAAMNFDFG